MAANEFEDFHDCLTDNYFQSNLSAGSEDSNSNICDPCFSDNVQREAKGFCFDCNEYLCNKCMHSHRRFGAFRDHDVLQGDSMPVKKQTNKQKCVFKFCEDHRMSEIQFYCLDDDSVFCGLCKLSKHSACNTQPITDTEGERKPAELSDLCLKLQTLKSEFENLKGKYRDKIEKIKEITSTYRGQVNKIRKEIESAFQELESQVDASIVDTPISGLAENLSTCEEAIRYLLSTKEHTERVKDSSDYIAKFAADVKLRKMISAYLVLQKTLPFKEEIVISDEISQKIAELQLLSEDIKRTILPESKCTKNVAKSKEPAKREFKDFAVQADLRVSTQPESSEVRFQPVNVEMQSQTSTVSVQPKVDNPVQAASSTKECHIEPTFKRHRIRINYLTTINRDEGLQSSITGTIFLPNGYTVFCDNTNCKLLLLDKDFGVCDKLIVNPAPFEVTLVNGKTLYVTQPEGKQYMRINVENFKLKQDTTIKVKRECWGIDAYKDKIVLSYHDNPGKGQIEVRLNTGQKIEGALFTPELLKPSHLKTNQINGNIYVTDTVSHTLICLSIKGQFLWKTENEAIRSPCGIALDHSGNCLVCVASTKRLVLVEEKQGKSEDIWSDSDIFNMWYIQNRVPESIAINWDDLTLVVGHKNKNQIQIIQLYCPKVRGRSLSRGRLFSVPSAK